MKVRFGEDENGNWMSDVLGRSSVNLSSGYAVDLSDEASRNTEASDTMSDQLKQNVLGGSKHCSFKELLLTCTLLV